MDAVERPQFRVVEGTRVPPLRCPEGRGGGMVSKSWSGVAQVGEGCPGIVPGCSPGTYSVEGSCCLGIEQVAAAGSGSSDS